MKTKTKFLILAIFFFFLCFSLISISFLILKKIEKTSKEILSTKSEFLALKQKAKEIENYQKIKKEHKEKFSQIEAVFFEKELPLPLITFLEKIAKEKAISIQIFAQEVKKPKGKEFFPFLNFAIKFSGKPKEVFSFLEKIEKAPFLIQIEKLTISKAKEEENLEGEVLIKVLTK